MQRAGPKYLMWYDGNPKLPVVDKIADAVDAYTRRFAIAPRVVLVNQSQFTECQDVVVQAVDFVRHNNFWVGLEP